MNNEAESLLKELRILMNLTGIPFEMEYKNYTDSDLKELKIKEEDCTLPIKYWSHVSWTPKDDKEWELLFKFEQILPFNFDSGAGFGQRDWELDWSFSCSDEPYDYNTVWSKLQKLLHPVTREELVKVLETDRTISGILNLTHPGIYGHDEYKFTGKEIAIYSPDIDVNENAIKVAESINSFLKDFTFNNNPTSSMYFYHKNYLHLVLHTGSNGIENSVISTLDCWRQLLEYCSTVEGIEDVYITDAYFDNLDDVYAAYIVIAL